MINLSQETEALARHIALAKHLSVEDAVRVALEEKACADGIDFEPLRRQRSPEDLVARRARTDKLVAALAAMPILDPRSPRDIMDDLNGL